MIRFICRQLAARPGRATLTLLSIVIGVVTVVTMTTVTTTTRRAYREMYTTLTGRADLEVISTTGAGFDGKIIDSLKQTSGVEAAVPILERNTVLYLGDVRRKLVVVGIDPDRFATLHDYEIVSGEFPSAAGQLMLDATFARSLNLDVGQELDLLSRRGVKQLAIIGLISPRSSTTRNPAGVIFLRLSDAQSLFARPNAVDVVQLVLTDDADSAAVSDSIAATLPDGLRVRRPVARAELSQEMLRATDLGLLFVSALTLQVAVIIILHAFFMNVSERRQQLATLRTIGATRRQIVGMVVGEGLVMGIIGSAIGLLIGLATGSLISVAMENLLTISVPRAEFSPGVLLAAALTGPGLALIGTALPALKASRLPPLEALRAIEPQQPHQTHRRLIAAAVALAVLSVVLFAGYWMQRLPIPAVIASGVLALLAAMLALPAIIRPAMHWFAAAFSRVCGPEGRLACEQLSRRPGRTALTVGVLFLAIASGIGIANALVNDIQDAQTWFGRIMTADFFVRATFPDPATGLASTLPDSIGDEIALIPGVKNVDRVRFVSGRAGNQPVVVISREFNQDDRLPLDLEQGEPAEVRAHLLAGDTVIGTALAERTNLNQGDSIELETSAGPTKLLIAGVVNEYVVGGLALYLDRATAQKLLNIEGADVFFIRTDPQNLNIVRPPLEKLSREQGLMLHSYAEFRRLFDNMTAGVVGSLWVLLALALAVAVFGIVNTLAMNVLEQTREIGLLRIIAMTQGQVRKTIFWQAIVIALLGLVPGAIAGVGVAWLINICTLPLLGHQVDFELHPLLVAVAFALAFVMVLAAALGPARRAARLNLGQALQYE